MDILDEYIERYAQWGRWGPDDQVGTANLITPEIVAEASRNVRTGEVISLSLPLDQSGPQTGAVGRFNPLRYSMATGTDAAAAPQLIGGRPMPREQGYADDVLIMPLQSTTHWDALCHVFHKKRMWNGYAATTVSSAGAVRNGAERLTDRLVGRGVLLDIPRSKAVDFLDPSYPITSEDLDRAAETQGVEVRHGDMLLLRTGEVGRCRKEGWGSYAGGPSPGLSLYTIPWIAEKQIAAVATDTWGAEVKPYEIADCEGPFHVVGLVYMGLLLGEMFDFEALASACAADGRYEMLVVAPPLRVTGSAGAPPCAVAIR
jgi:kynurenine formamidase